MEKLEVAFALCEVKAWLKPSRLDGLLVEGLTVVAFRKTPKTPYPHRKPRNQDTAFQQKFLSEEQVAGQSQHEEDFYGTTLEVPRPFFSSCEGESPGLEISPQTKEDKVR